jgi:hypothetical protein
LAALWADEPRQRRSLWNSLLSRIEGRGPSQGARGQRPLALLTDKHQHQPLEFLHGQRLGAAVGGDVGGVQQGFAAEGAQGAAQHFAALAEGGGGEAFHGLEVFAGRLVGFGDEADEGGVDFWRGGEDGGGDVHDDGGVAEPLRDDGEAAVGGGVGGGADALGDFELEHEGERGEFGGLGEPVYEEDRADIVGQVADDGARGGDEGGDIGFERVGLDDGEAACGGFPQCGDGGDGAGVEFDGGDVERVAGQQSAGEAAGAGADFHDIEAGERLGACADGGEEMRVEQKMLAEGLISAEVVGSNDLAQGGKKRKIRHCACYLRVERGNRGP